MSPHTTDAGVGRQVPVSRRSALRTGGLAALAAGLLGAAGAAPASEPPPWSTADPELAPILERLARAVAAYPGEPRRAYALLDGQAEYLETVTRTWNDPRPARA